MLFGLHFSFPIKLNEIILKTTKMVQNNSYQRVLLFIESMYLFGTPPSIFMLILGKSINYTVFISYFLPTFWKFHETIMIRIVSKTIQCTNYTNFIWKLLILDIIFLNIIDFLRYFLQFLFLWSSGIQNIQFCSIPKKSSLSLRFNLVLYKKEHKSEKNTNKTTKILRNSFYNELLLMIRISLATLCIIGCFDRLNETKQHISVVIQIANLSGNKLISQIVPQLYRIEKITGAGLGCERENIPNGWSYSQKNISISHCFFSRSSSYPGNGGVIFVGDGSYSMNVNNSMFYNCLANDGGAIWFVSPNSYLRMICANRCSVSSGYYHFAYLYASHVNQVEYLSVSFSSFSQTGCYSIYMKSGDQRVDNTNSSMNSALQNPGICIYTPSLFTSSYCTFSNNKVSQYICIYFYSTSETISMSYANIVHNNSPSRGVVYVDKEGIRKMMYCIFKNNSDYLFCIWKGTLEVSHSFIDHSGSFSSSTPVSTEKNNSLTVTITYHIQFFSSHYCHTDLLLFDKTPVKTIDNSPVISFEESLRMTFERTIDQTIRETHNILPFRSYDEISCTNLMANKREINVIFSLFSLSYFQL